MSLPEDSLLAPMLRAYPRAGSLAWIGLRPERRMPMRMVTETRAIAGQGLEGDHRRRPGKREVTLIQWEHLPAIAALAGREAVDPAWLRRNLAVAGMPLVSLIGARFRVGDALFEGAGHCQPCSRMEEVLGAGGYNAMRGHGGIVARVVVSGRVWLGAAVEFVELAG
jgi:MOSC domain-containing protein YiiM